MLNEYLSTEDSLLEQINVNPLLESAILDDMPKEWDDTRKAIYVYIKMCKILSYNEEVFAVNREGPLDAKHRDIGHLYDITPTNNGVTCFEFNAIHSYILNKLGINYKRGRGVFDETGSYIIGEDFFDPKIHQYGRHHTFAKYRTGKYVSRADAAGYMLQGDMARAKLNQPLRSLVCENKNEQSRKEFNALVSEVYAYIASKEPKLSQNDIEDYETRNDIVKEFERLTDKLFPVSIEEEVDILINKINSTKLTGIDAYSYLLQLRKVLFTKDEQENIKISIIRKSGEGYAEALAIISLFIPSEDGNISIERFMYTPGSELVPISIEELEENFDKNIMGYIKPTDPKIPGFNR